MFRRALFLLVPLSFCLSIGCGEDPVTADEQNATEDAVATLSFDGSFDETVKGKLVDGGRAIVNYDDERLAECKGEQGGVPQYAVTAYYKIDEGDVGKVVVAGLQAPDEPSIELDGAGTLEVWFEVTNRWGCHQWDSNFGDNYVFEVAEAD